MKKYFLFALTVGIGFASTAQTKPAVKKTATASSAKVTSAPQLKNALDSFSYALGMNVAQNVKEQGMTTVNANLIQKAFDDVFKGRPELFSQEVAMNILQTEMMKVSEKKSAGEKAKGTAFLTENKKRKGVITLPNGLQYEVLVAGDPNSIKARPIDTVKVDYVGTTITGEEFDSSIKRGEPTEFPLNGVIKGWTEILQLMPVGSKWKVFIPSDLAYGDRGAGAAIGPGATLIFEITLHEVKPAK